MRKKHIAVIGMGQGGMVAAYYLAKALLITNQIPKKYNEQRIENWQKKYEAAIPHID